MMDVYLKEYDDMLPAIVIAMKNNKSSIEMRINLMWYHKDVNKSRFVEQKKTYENPGNGGGERSQYESSNHRYRKCRKSCFS